MNDFKEKSFKLITYIAALASIMLLLGIIFSVFAEGIPLFKTIKIAEFLFGRDWYPTHGEAPQFGIWNLLIGSLLATFGALVIAVPLGLGSAIFISEIAGSRLREIAKPVIELLAAIPSVVYGLFGMAVLAPFVRTLFNVSTGLNLLSTSIILGLMVVPIIASMSEDALSTVPKQLREASLALGATPWETISKVVVPAARSGIVGSVLLGFGRAIGETMVVLMVAGGSAQIPRSIFDSLRPLTSTIAAEMGETVVGDLHYRSLFAIAILLFIITFVTNMFTEIVILKRGKA
ncbi:MAG TPA: phosphate ABC transporter permease subunit PstC [Candidatus Cloacimonadota bacterium]|nr:phosphate ABC transporter permease subunit PstC [Candidatus Cloacimonadota bacterium]HOH79768.1 phosphate ABC transporter permease subunit PstC [Candidatus Cloacimonadota bacterium]